MNIIFLGPPGAGKGTQARLLSEKLNIPHLSIGQLLREEYEKGTKEGITGERYWGERGINVPSSISFSILKKYLNNPGGFILDNFPRTRSNLNALKKYLKENNKKIDFVFHLRVDRDESYIRLIKRGNSDQKKLGRKRLDEKEELIKTRWDKGYQKDIKPILAYYRQCGILNDINGQTGIKAVFSRVMEIINQKKVK